ncbi:MAG: Fic family protein [Fermentimonas sp.]|nr:Fic family protein [Fermentimonas sp.]
MQYDLKDSVNYHYGQFPPKDVDYSFFINELLGATDALARFDQMLKNMHNNEILLAPLRNREALLSSRIEGTISTMDEIMQYEADDDGTASVQAKTDVIEIVLYQRALKNAQEILDSGYQLTVNFIRQLHQQLLYAGRGASKSPGEFKTSQNYLADKTNRKIEYLPIRPEHLEEGLEKLIRFSHESTLPPLVKVAIIHLEFEALHPFKDGNGRIGRMLITLQLWLEKMLSQPYFYISDYFDQHRAEYIQSMRNVSRTGNWNEWIRFFLEAVRTQAISNLKISEEIQKLYEDMKQEFISLLSSKWNIEILDFLFTNPVFRNNKFVKGIGIPNATAALIIKKLLDTGILVQKEEASGRRAALYSFEPLMNLVRV